MNLELIINGDRWNVVEITDKYFMVNTYTKTLYTHESLVGRAKYFCWQSFHEPFKEYYY